MRFNLLARTAIAGVCMTALVAPTSTSAASVPSVAHARAATHTITATVTKHGVSLKGVKGLHAGRAKIVVKGKGHDTVTFASLKKGYAMSRFLKDLHGFETNNAKAIKRIYAKVDALGGVVPGDTGSIVFPHPGTYFAMPGGGRISEPTTFTVGSKRQTRTPDVDGRIVATDGPGWGGSTTIPAKGTLMFKNTATTPVLHFVSMQRVAEGTTVETVLEALQSDQGPDPDWVLSGSLETDVLSPHRAMTVDYDLPAGQYVVLCFMPDPKMHGMPHALMGMIEMIHLG
ncbi:hypothetical protein [Nocardioides sp. Soil805]|uniref:hypothetical protein n=1 Tax=Nocardioides sp. Soil805 TaxID=1736416 RepID=UPI0007028868|nr:hypothetical protein [Nocardioides sp. Soil805]KRF30662.1 hypothetical protein ASG94_19275 [Nocardioides sp. Soil805]